jgi:hypothetical protein
MKTIQYSTEKLVALFHERLVLTLPEIKNVLHTNSTMTAHRKLHTIGYQTSYSHSGRYYTLKEIAEFDRNGLWEFNHIYFSKHGKLAATIEHVVTTSPAGYFASELKQLLNVFVLNELKKLHHEGKLKRQQIGREFLYLSTSIGSVQLQRRKEQIQQAVSTNLSAPNIGKNRFDEEEHLLAFLSVLNEKQRRLFLGFESLRLGYGGDKALSKLSGIDVRTIAKGRQELLRHDISIDRVRKAGAGRPAFKKN